MTELIAWTAEKCEYHEDVARRELIAKAEIRVPIRDGEADLFKAKLSYGSMTLIPTKVLNEFLNERDDLCEDNRALRMKLAEIENALAVLRDVGMGVWAND